MVWALREFSSVCANQQGMLAWLAFFDSARFRHFSRRKFKSFP